MWLPAIGALVGGVGGYFGKKAEVDEFEKSKRKSIDKLMESKYSPEEQLGELRGIDTMTQNQLGTALNTSAFATRNTTNSGVAQAAMVAPVVATGLSMKAQRLGEITNYNKLVDTKIAGIESTSMPQAGLSDFILGGMAGAQAGMSADYLLSQVNPAKPVGQAPEVPKLEVPMAIDDIMLSDIEPDYRMYNAVNNGIQSSDIATKGFESMFPSFNPEEKLPPLYSDPNANLFIPANTVNPIDYSINPVSKKQGNLNRFRNNYMPDILNMDWY